MKPALATLTPLVALIFGLYLARPEVADGQQAGDKSTPVGWDGGERFTVPPDFHVERAVRPPADDKTFSLIHCCFDDKGRLLVSKENGPILLCAQADKRGVLQEVKVFCDLVKNCQGMTWIRDALWLVGDGPEGTGLYRCRDTKQAGRIDEVALVQAFKGGGGEHGPHAVLQGPDGLIYLVVGRQASLNHNKSQANLRAPGGTIWRMEQDGKNLALVAAGLGNARGAAFAPNGDLFTCDGDSAGDENLPWYRPARVYHCPPGADFLWRAGAANTPDYYIDTLPPIGEIGCGAPGGMQFYDHAAYPKEYRNGFFAADASAGEIYVVHLERNGASYKAKVERFCQCTPTNVTDLCVGPDGALYFTMSAGKGQGGVYRIVYKEGKSTSEPLAGDGAGTLAPWPQPQASWSQKNLATAPVPAGFASLAEYVWEQFVNDAKISSANRIRMTTAFQQLGQGPTPAQIAPLSKDKDAALRAHAVWLIGVNRFDQAAPDVVEALADTDTLVRRRACEALVRLGVEPPIAKLWPLLGDKDRFVRHAARLVLERIDSKKWVHKVWTEPKSYREINESASWNGIVALCRTNRAPAHVEEIFGRLHGNQTNPSQGAVNYPVPLLEWLRTIQITLAHNQRRPIWTGYIAKQCAQLFAHDDWRVNRELAILLVEFQREGQLEKPIQGRLLQALAAKKTDRLQQIHYANCMRLLRSGWTSESVQAMADWYEGTRTWSGGHNFARSLENIFKDCTVGFTVADKERLLEKAEKTPLAATALAKQLQVVPQPALLPALQDLATRLKTAKDIPGQAELAQAVAGAITLSNFSPK